MPFRRALFHALPPLIFWIALLALSLAGVEARYSMPALAAVAAIHLLLAATLYLLLAVGRRMGKASGFLAAAMAALVVIWHCRELTYRPSSLLVVPLAALVLALPIHAWMRAGPEPWPLRRLLPALAGAGIATAVAVAAAFESSNLLRWHLLRHNKLYGTPAYYALAEGVAELREELFARHRPGATGEEEKGQMDERDAGPRPHLVFILLDTLRADALAMGGGERDDMPRLNEFLDGAYRFTDVMANASWTRPSIASMITGLLPEEHGARDVDDPLEERFTTLAETLRGHGYETAALVSNIGAVGRTAGFAQGFDFFHELSATPYARAGQVRGSLERWLAGRDAEDARPLFLYLHFLDPHDPYLAGREPAHKSFAEYAAAYRAELAYLDEELARAIELLEALPGPKAFLVASDHGEEFGEHEEFGHGYSLYREVIHIPVAFHVGDGGAPLDAPLEGRDVHDLVTSWAAAGGALDVPAWAASRRRGERYASLYYSSRGRLLLRPYLRRVVMRSLERGGTKLIESAYGATFELYEAAGDPAERRNLAAERHDTVERLASGLDRAVTRWTFPPPYERSPEELEQLRALGYVGD